jgi:hypothetical protein
VFPEGIGLNICRCGGSVRSGKGGSGTCRGGKEGGERGWVEKGAGERARK